MAQLAENVQVAVVEAAGKILVAVAEKEPNAPTALQGAVGSAKAIVDALAEAINSHKNLS
jgi:hypothetical protein